MRATHVVWTESAKRHTPSHPRVGVGRISSADIRGAAYIGCQALVVGRVAAASAGEELIALLQRLPDRPS